MQDIESEFEFLFSKKKNEKNVFCFSFLIEHNTECEERRRTSRETTKLEIEKNLKRHNLKREEDEKKGENRKKNTHNLEYNVM